jgi:cell division protein ZapA
MAGSRKSTVVVKIQGQEYHVEGEGKPERIVEVARYVDDKMKELTRATGVAPSARMAVLTAMNIAEELFREREAQGQDHEEFDRRLSSLAEILERELA